MPKSKYLYMITCTEVNYNAGGTRSHVGIFNNKNVTIQCLFEHHDSNCNYSILNFGDCDDNNITECNECKFYNKEENEEKKLSRIYCTKCIEKEKKIFISNNYPLDLLCCEKCTYECSGDTYIREYCNNCKKICYCKSCSYDFWKAITIINNGVPVRKEYSYIKTGDYNVYVAIDIFDKNDNYETSWNS
jgi:hypothetical protein